jgi:hypothetical protein
MIIVTIAPAYDALHNLPQGVHGTAERHLEPVVKAFTKLYTGRRAGAAR